MGKLAQEGNKIGVERIHRAFEGLEGFASNVLGVSNDPRDSLNRMRRRFVIAKRGGRADLRTFGCRARRTSSGGRNRIVVFNKVSGFYSLLLSRTSRDGFRRSFGRRERDSSFRNVSGRRRLNGRHGRSVSRLSFRSSAKRNVGSFVRGRDTFEEGWRVRDNS
jgi:hypothetical protein